MSRVMTCYDKYGLPKGLVLSFAFREKQEVLHSEKQISKRRNFKNILS
jgi:hypothetical protein